MKTLSTKGKISGFTLIEVLVVIAIIAVLAAMLLPARSGPRRAYAAMCMSNQKQVCLGMLMWNSDNGDQFPWQASTVTNGTRELITNGLASAQFRALASYIKYPAVYICPTDHNREMATNVQMLAEHNLSYFIDVDATTNSASVILTGDRHLLAGGKPVAPGLFNYTNSVVMDWSKELHSNNSATGIGVLGFVDGHAQVVRGNDLDGIFKKQGMAAARLEVP